MEGAVPGKPVIVSSDPYFLSSEDKRKEMEAVNIIKEKRDGAIKGRSCANGRNQNNFFKEGELVESPKYALES